MSNSSYTWLKSIYHISLSLGFQVRSNVSNGGWGTTRARLRNAIMHMGTRVSYWGLTVDAFANGNRRGGVKTVTAERYVDSKGKKRYKGTSKLRSTEKLGSDSKELFEYVSMYIYICSWFKLLFFAPHNEPCKYSIPSSSQAIPSASLAEALSNAIRSSGDRPDRENEDVSSGMPWAASQCPNSPSHHHLFGVARKFWVLAVCWLKRLVLLFEGSCIPRNTWGVETLHPQRTWMSCLKGCWSYSIGPTKIVTETDDFSTGLNSFVQLFKKKVRVWILKRVEPVRNPYKPRILTIQTRILFGKPWVCNWNPGFPQPVRNPYRPRILPVQTRIIYMGSG